MNFIEVFDNALSTEDCKYIIDFMNTEGVLAPGMVSTLDGNCKVKENHKLSHEITMDLRGDVPKSLQNWSNYDVYDNVNITIGNSLLDKKIFEKNSKNSKLNLLLKEIAQSFSPHQIKEGGFFIMIGKKK